MKRPQKDYRDRKKARYRDRKRRKKEKRRNNKEKGIICYKNIYYIANIFKFIYQLTSLYTLPLINFNVHPQIC